MLVLSRKVGEKIVVGDNITIVVNRVNGSRISLGIEAPADVRIVRGELSKAEESVEGNAASAPALGMPALDFTAESIVHRAR